MDRAEFERNYQIESTYWWNIGRFHIVDAFTRRYIRPKPGDRMLDLGAGTGATTRWLQKFGEVLAVDDSPLALAYCRKRGLKVTRSNMEHLKFRTSTIDAAFALDILEHVKDDRKALREIHRILKPGGKVLFTVPAYQWLFSEHDEVCHHQRRYTLGEMAHKVGEAGLRTVRKSYCITFLLFPLVALLHFRNLFKSDRKIMASVVPLPAWLNLPLVWMLDLENLLLRFINLPFGVSVILLAEKPQEK